MSEPLPQPDRLPRRRPGWRLALILALVGGALLALWHFDPQQWHVPLCSLYATTGLHCPGCGSTRATHELLHGRLLEALRYNALWVLGLPVVMYAAASEIRFLLYGRPLWGDPTHKPWFFLTLAALAVVFFVLRNIPSFPFVLLAPPG